MKRAAPTTAATVFSYGCLAPTAGLDHARTEVALQRAMWDLLVSADRAAEQAQEQAARTDPDIATALDLIDRLSADLGDAAKARRSARAASRAKIDTPDLDALIADLAVQRRNARAALWPRLAAWRKANKETVADIERERRERNKAIRKSSGLYWGNYNRIVDAFDRTRKRVYSGGGRPRFSDRDRSDGVLTVQIQRTGSGLGASMAELMGGKFNALQIGPVDPRAFDPATPRGERTRLARTAVEIRIDAAGHLLHLPLVLHRLPPEHARIKAAQLTWKSEGERTRYQLALTCVAPAQAAAHHSPRAGGLDIGWRLEPDGRLLVATLWDGARLHRYRLPADWMEGMDQVERLAAHIDDGLIGIARVWHLRVADLPDDLRQPLMGWRPKLGARHVNAQALHDAVRGRIAAVLGTGQRADVPPDLRAWYDRYRHLNVWRDNLRAKLQRRRLDTYRLFARDIAGRCALLGIEDFDLSEVARTRTRAPETGDNPLSAAARANRVRASLFSLVQEIGHQAAKSGTELVEIRGPSTQTCHVCNGETAPADRAQRVWTCAHCGAQWDQDANAARLLHAVATEGAIGRVMPVPA